MRYRVEGAAHRVAGQRRQAGLVHLMAEIVQHMMVVAHVAVVLRRDRDLVRDAPADDAGVVVVLDDQLLHLADRVFTAIGHVLGNVGDLSPDDHAGLIAEVVEVLVVLVVRQTDRVRAQLLNELHILVVHLARDGIAQTLAILMAGDAVQRIRAAIEEEAPLGVNREAAHAEVLAYLVLYLAVQHEAHRAGVEIRVADAVPQVRVLQRDRRVPALAGQHLGTGGVVNRELDLAVALHPGLDLDVSVCAVDSGRDLHARAAEVIQRDVVPVDDQQADVAVDAAVEGEVSLLGVDAVVFAVVRFHDQLIAVGQKRRDIRAEGGVAAVVAGDLHPVQRDLGAGIHALKLQPDLLGILVKSGRRKPRLVDAGAAPVVVAAVLAVDVVPGVRQVHGSGLTVRTGELPVLHQLGRASHCALLCCFLLYLYCTELLNFWQ